MHTNDLIIAQQAIAMARIGLLPTQQDSGRALAAIAAVQNDMRRAGRSALDLEPARIAAAILALGRRPDKSLCVDAVQSIAAVLREWQRSDERRVEGVQS